MCAYVVYVWMTWLRMMLLSESNAAVLQAKCGVAGVTRVFLQRYLRPCTRAGQRHPLQGLTLGIPSRLMLGDESKAGWDRSLQVVMEQKVGRVLFPMAECRFQSNDFWASNPLEIFHVPFHQCQHWYLFLGMKMRRCKQDRSQRRENHLSWASRTICGRPSLIYLWAHITLF